ncbi:MULTISPECIES: hypothetical protein [Microbispora]|uniref:Uncharacterized protein n=1 Tax=Microbispora siamensis TaxID=564413 RepID=A0ABQ4GQ43_9ACTN|nr:MULTISPECIES: hypothetical protein [Microbispora]OPG07897.1 hypothetical protein B1L11_29550 [Microbispora sp. GKU 823]GIH63561.1 hypothetical protein Msi02_43780 [Microbispora siamensis]
MRPESRPERPRRVHRTDWMALLCGLLFIGMGIRYLTGPDPDAVIMAPILVGGLGFAAFVAILAKAIRR